MLSPIPRRGSWDHRFCSCSPSTCQPSPIRGAGRPAHRPFRGLLGVHSRYGLYTRHVTEFRDALVTEGFNCFVTSTAAPVASGWSISPGGTLTTGKRRLSTAHPESGQCLLWWPTVVRVLGPLNRRRDQHSKKAQMHDESVLTPFH